jgi:hypothetical protein
MSIALVCPSSSSVAHISCYHSDDHEKLLVSDAVYSGIEDVYTDSILRVEEEGMRATYTVACSTTLQMGAERFSGTELYGITCYKIVLSII